MGRLTIAINGKRLFEGEGEAAEVEAVEQQVRAVADSGNMTADSIAEIAVVGIAERGGLMQPVMEVELLALVYFVLNLPIDEADRPGRIRDYIPRYDFDVDVGCDLAAQKFRVEVHGTLDPGIHRGRRSASGRFDGLDHGHPLTKH
jgi:hypothetical protein